MLKDIKNRKVTVSGGHYHSTDELLAENREHVSALQKIVGSVDVRQLRSKIRSLSQ